MKWQRPSSVPAQVWSRFQGSSLENGEPPRTYKIRDLEDKHKEQCKNLLVESFLQDEPLSIALGVSSDQNSIKAACDNWENLMSQHVSLACFTEPTSGSEAELVGVNVLFVRSREDENDKEVKAIPLRKLFKTLATADGKVDIFNHYGVDAYLTDSGMVVSRAHRGQGIGTKILEAREPLCKALGIKAISTVFTSKTSRVAARRVGYSLLATLQYSEMLEYGVDLNSCISKFAELRGKKLY